MSRAVTEPAHLSSPTVSIVLPTLQEQGYIRDCLDSLLAQDYGQIIEVLVADGRSTDRTPDIIDTFGPPVRRIDNPGVSAAAGLNACLREATGDVIVRADAHTLYARDYVTRCVEALLETGAANVGGSMTPVGATPFGRAVAAVTCHPLGVGPGRFHFQGDSREEVDTVYLGCFWAEMLRDVGGYDDEGIQWGAEDHELNLRIAATGGSIVLDPQIKSTYFPRESPRGLARQYHNYGLGKASTLRKHHTLPTWRPLAPAGLVLASGVLAILGRGYFQRAALPTVHAAVVGVSAISLSRDAGVAPHRAFAAMWIAHWSYGLGFLRGLVRTALGRRPDRKRS